MKKIGKLVGKRIKRVRTDRGLSQTDFGDKIGVTFQYVYCLENSIRRPSQSLVIAIGAVFGEDKEAGEILSDWLRTGRKG